MYISFLHMLEHGQQTTFNPFFLFQSLGFSLVNLLFYFTAFHPLAFTRSTLFYSVSCSFQCFLRGPAYLGVVSGQLTRMLFHGRLWLWCLKGSEPCSGASCLLGQGDLCPSLQSWISCPPPPHPREGVSSSFQLSVPGCLFSVASAGCLWLSVYLCIMRLHICVCVSWGKRPS